VNFTAHLILNIFVAFFTAIPLFLALLAVSFITTYGSPRDIKFAYIVRRELRTIPRNAVLECQGKRVSALIYNRADDEEAAVFLYSAPSISKLAWPTGPRTAESMRNRANLEVALRAGSLVFVYIPLVAGCLWLAISASLLWLTAAAALLAALVHNVTKKQEAAARRRELARPFSSTAIAVMILSIILYRYHLYSISAVYAINVAMYVATRALIEIAARASM
jgi:hypothetical protein